jgi:hypothetical protein
MNLAPYPEHTKQTRCNNNLTFKNDRNFFRPIMSNNPVLLNYNHDHYNIDNNAMAMNQFDIERGSVSTRNKAFNEQTPVQTNFQNNFDNNLFSNIGNNQDQEINKYLIRNPVNTRRDNIEKIRNNERQDFLKSQGGMLSDFNQLTFENTRKYKQELNSNSYIPMARTMAIPKENI